MVARDSLAALLIKAVGFRNGINVLCFITAWGTVYEKLGHAPTIEEYADWWKISRAKAFREQQLFRRAVPGYETPQVIWEWARTLIDTDNPAAPVLLGGLSFS